MMTVCGEGSKTGCIWLAVVCIVCLSVGIFVCFQWLQQGDFKGKKRGEVVCV